MNRAMPRPGTKSLIVLPALLAICASSALADAKPKKACAGAPPEFEGAKQLYSCVPAKKTRKNSIKEIRFYNWFGDKSRGLIQWDVLYKGIRDESLVGTLSPARVSRNTDQDPNAYPVRITFESTDEQRWTFTRQHEGETTISVRLPNEGEREFVCNGGF
jgi:hypothetical protein